MIARGSLLFAHAQLRARHYMGHAGVSLGEGGIIVKADVVGESCRSLYGGRGAQ